MFLLNLSLTHVESLANANDNVTFAPVREPLILPKSGLFSREHFDSADFTLPTNLLTPSLQRRPDKVNIFRGDS